MRRKKSSEIRLFSILLVATLLMTAGCGREEQSEDTGQMSENDSAQETSASSDALRVCLVDRDRKQLDAALESFEEKYPDIKVELETISTDNFEAERKRVSSELMAGEGCDLYYYAEQLLEDPYKAQQAGAFTDLIPLLEEYTELTPEDFADGTFDTLENGEECYIFPLVQSFPILVIRKDMQEKLGITTDSWKNAQDLKPLLDAFYEMYPGEDPLSPYEFFDIDMELFGFRIWQGTDNIEILNKADWKGALDIMKEMRYSDGISSEFGAEETSEDYEKMEQEEEKIYQNQIPCLAKKMGNVNDLETYIRMGGEADADLFPEYDVRGQISSMGLRGIAISENCKRKADAIRLVQEIIIHNVSVGNQITTWKEGNRLLMENLRAQYGSGEVALKGKVYPGLTDATFEKLETFINQAVPYYPVYVDVQTHIGTYMEEYLQGKVSYEEFMKKVEDYLEIYYSE